MLLLILHRWVPRDNAGTYNTKYHCLQNNELEIKNNNMLTDLGICVKTDIIEAARLYWVISITKQPTWA